MQQDSFHTDVSGEERHYSDDSFWSKSKRFALKAGRNLIETALTLYYVAQSEHTPVWAKGMVYAALGYFINAFDAIPDITPGMGFVDDLAVLMAAIAGVAAYIKPDIKERADHKMREWFATDEVEKPVDGQRVKVDD